VEGKNEQAGREEELYREKGVAGFAGKEPISGQTGADRLALRVKTAE